MQRAVAFTIHGRDRVENDPSGAYLPDVTGGGEAAVGLGRDHSVRARTASRAQRNCPVRLTLITVFH
jgi:hypothetical protein